MPITPEQPIVVPPTGGITFDQQWVYNLVVHAPAIDSGRVLIELLPFDQSTGSIGPASLLETIQTDQLWQAASEVPEVVAAMQAVIDCVGPLRNWIKLQNADNSEVSPDGDQPILDPEPPTL